MIAPKGSDATGVVATWKFPKSDNTELIVSETKGMTGCGTVKVPLVRPRLQSSETGKNDKLTVIIEVKWVAPDGHQIPILHGIGHANGIPIDFTEESEAQPLPATTQP
jgi:hypothetical protein